MNFLFLLSTTTDASTAVPTKTNEDKLIDFGSSDAVVTNNSEQTSTNLNNNFIDSNSSLITHNLNNNNNLVAASEINDERGESLSVQEKNQFLLYLIHRSFAAVNNNQRRECLKEIAWKCPGNQQSSHSFSPESFVCKSSKKISKNTIKSEQNFTSKNIY